MRKITTNFKKTLEIYKKRKKLIVTIILALAVLFPFYISIRDVIIDSIPFWFDPARDLLMAWDSLSKPTLIGPPSGIPGIFYGPYWIWFLSFGLLFSKDPRVATSLVLTIPYFTIFPLLLFQFAKIFGKKIVVLLWLIFIFAYKNYTTYIWNPHLAPIFFLAIIYLFTFTDFASKKVKDRLQIILAGFSAGVLTNLHISFGIAITTASVLFLVLEFFLSHPKNKWRALWKERLFLLLSFLLGFSIAILPNLAFEVRHGFNQVKAAIFTVTNALLYDSPVVGYVGLGKNEIMSTFLSILGKLLNVSIETTYFIYAAILIHLVVKRKTYFTGISKPAKKLLLFLTLCTTIMMALYLSSKNPVWDYHFIGSEVIILLLFGFVLSKFPLLKYSAILWTAVLVVNNIYGLTKPSEVHLYQISNLATKKHIADIIYQDTQKEPFALGIYSTAIYTFDYDYIFRWYGIEKYRSQFPQEIDKIKYVYLIIPRIEEAYKVDFIDYKTPKEKYKTINEWRIPDGTTILKREKLL